MYATLELFAARPASQKRRQNLDGISHSNVLEVFEVCLELPSDSKDQFGFVVDEFPELVRNRKSPCSRHLERLVTRLANFKFRIIDPARGKGLSTCWI